MTDHRTLIVGEGMAVAIVLSSKSCLVIFTSPDRALLRTQLRKRRRSVRLDILEFRHGQLSPAEKTVVDIAVAERSKYVLNDGIPGTTPVLRNGVMDSRYGTGILSAGQAGID